MSEELHDLVAAYALNALEELDSRRFERHLDGCAECKRELTELQEATTLLAELSAEPAPAHLRRKIIAELPASGRSRRFAWVLAIAAAALALVFGGLWATSVSRLSQVEQIAAVYQAPDSQLVGLTGSEGEGRFTHSSSLGRGVFLSEDLDAAPSGSVYELWLIDDAGPHPAGLFEAGDAVIVEGFAPGQVIAVTLEPSGGSELPTGPVLLSGEL